MKLAAQVSHWETGVTELEGKNGGVDERGGSQMAAEDDYTP